MNNICAQKERDRDKQTQRKTKKNYVKEREKESQTDRERQSKTDRDFFGIKVGHISIILQITFKKTEKLGYKERWVHKEKETINVNGKCLPTGSRQYRQHFSLNPYRSK